MTVDEVADLLGLSARTIRRRVKEGALKPAPESFRPYAKVSPKLLFDRREVEKLMKESKST